MKKIASESWQATGLNKALDDGFVYALSVGPLRGNFGGGGNEGGSWRGCGARGGVANDAETVSN